MHTLLIAFVILSGLLIAIGVWLGWQLLRQNGRILLRLDDLEQRLNEIEFGGTGEPKGLPVGAEAPAFELPDLAGAPRTLAEFRGRPLLLIFFHPECGYCRKLAPQLAAPRSEEARCEVSTAPPQVIIITEGDAEINRAFFAEHNLTCPVLQQQRDEVAKAYQAGGTPTGYLINAEGHIVSELAFGAEPLLKLAGGTGTPASFPAVADRHEPAGQDAGAPGSDRSAAASRFGNRSLGRSKLKRDGLKAGTPAPDFRLPRLDGRGEISLSELKGQRVLLVFSDPHCGPCQEFAPELELFHREHPEVEVLMISRGEPRENRAKVKEHGLTFTVALQRQWEISRRYAMFATPVAYLVDEQGILRHDVAVGSEAIRALAQQSAADLTQSAAVAAAADGVLLSLVGMN